MLLRRRAALPQRWLLFGRPLLFGAVITSTCRFSSSSTSSASSASLPKDHHDQHIPPSSKGSDGGAPPSSRIHQEVAESIHLMSIDGFEWIDFVARPEAMESILHDGGFVLATRGLLHQHGVARDVVARVSRDVWLPITHFSGDAESIAIVTRVPSSHGDKVSTGFVWAQGVSNSVKQEINKRGGGGGGGDDTDDTTTEENHGETRADHSAISSDDTDRSQENKDMTILGLTVRLNIFIHRPSKKIITVHRYPLKFIMELQRDWHLKHRFDSIHTMLFRLMQASTKNFEERQVEYSRRLDWLESTLFREDEEAARRDRVGLDDDVVATNFRSKRGAHVSLSSSPRSQGATSDNRSRRHAAWSVVRNV
ncbi:ion transporter, putative, partial [Bodo saltans]